MLNVGIIGLGFIGSTHLAAWNAARAAGIDCKVVAVADPKPERRAGDLSRVRGNVGNLQQGSAFDATDVTSYAQPLELLADERVHAVSICTPTVTHVDLAIAAMRAGKDVLLEKPVALASADVERVIAAQSETGRFCMPAMCMRFWPAWSWLKDRIVDGAFGKVRTASFTRLGTRPRWSETYASNAETGGGLIDLHIHDVDFIRHCFGDPRRVTSAGRISDDGLAIDHVTSLFDYGADGPPHVTAEGGWDHLPGFAYRMRYIVNFERATADFDISRDPQLLLCRDGVPAEAVKLDPLLGYDHEVRYFARAVLDRRAPTMATLDDALRLSRLLEAEVASIRSNTTITLK